MTDQERGREICNLINRAMPCFIRNLNHIIHKYNDHGYNLNGNQIKVINGVRILRSISPAELSRILNMQKGSLTTIISSLCEMRLLKKTYSSSDPRRYNVSITREAEKVLALKNDSDSLQYAEIFADIPEDDFLRIKDGLTMLLDFLDSNGDPRDD